jgi:hypothetical protein
MTDVYLALAALAKETIRNYASDFYQHDAAVLFKMQPGDVALWAPRRDGSCFIIVARDRRVNERAKENLEAFQSNFPDLQWQVIDCDSDGNWSAQPESSPSSLIAAYAVQTQELNKAYLRRGENPPVVREFHM